MKNKLEYTHEDIDVKDHHGNTALFYAVKNSNLEITKLLLDIGADINKKCEFGNAPLHQAFINGDSVNSAKMIKFLINSGANVKI